MVRQYLSSFDWAKYSMHYAITTMPEHLLDTRAASDDCDQYEYYARTRCLFSTYLAQEMLNRHDVWRRTPIDNAVMRMGTIMAMNIEVDVEDWVDHMFMLFRLDGQWYVIQSYIGQYPAIIEKVDGQRLIRDIQRWEREGVPREEWFKWFHVWIPESMDGVKTVSHIYATNHIYPEGAPHVVDRIDRRMYELLSDPNSYIHNEEYLCLI